MSHETSSHLKLEQKDPKTLRSPAAQWVKCWPADPVVPGSNPALVGGGGGGGGGLFSRKCGTIAHTAGLCSAVGSTSDSRARGARFKAWSGHILVFLLPLIQEGQLSVTGKSMCTK